MAVAVVRPPLNQLTFMDREITRRALAGELRGKDRTDACRLRWQRRRFNVALGHAFDAGGR